MLITVLNRETGFQQTKKWRLNSRDGLCLITYVVSHAATVNKLLENTPEVENDVF